MSLYFLFYLVPLFLFVLERTDEYTKLLYRYLWVINGICLILLIGLKFQIGPDWHAYHDMYLRASEIADIENILYINRDLGFALLNFLSAKYISGDFGLIIVNLICSVVFICSILRFCKVFEYSTLALSICLPYLIFIVGIGYQRQAVAIALYMLGLVFLFQGKVYKYLLMLTFAALFHKTAMILAPLILLSKVRINKYLIMVILSLTLFGIYDALISSSVDLLVSSYIDRERESSGAFFRIMMLIIPAILFFLFRKKFHALMHSEIYVITAALSLCVIFIPIFMLISSTAVDRISLYFIPIQVIVYCKLIEVFSNVKLKMLTMLLIYSAYGAFLFVWLYFSSYSRYWIPFSVHEMFSIF